ncbi:Type I transmembrane sorting receptor [Tulasnella sp. 331]|nr:Type I transmembrane sorting receptor [Tulasnella sp. 331]
MLILRPKRTCTWPGVKPLRNAGMIYSGLIIANPLVHSSTIPNMLFIAISLVVLDTFGLSAPIKQRPRVAVISLLHRAHIATADNIFNKEGVAQDLTRVTSKYSARAVLSSIVVSTALAAKKTGSVVLEDDYDSGINELRTPLTYDDVPSRTVCKITPSNSPIFDPGLQSRISESAPACSPGTSAKHAGDGMTTNGRMASDTITVTEITLSGVQSGAITSESDGASGGPNAGLLELGFPGNSVISSSTPWFIAVAKSGLFVSEVFSFKMTCQVAAGSELCIGRTNSAHHPGSITYHPLNPNATCGIQLYWDTPSIGLKYGNNSLADEDAFSAVIDSGATLVCALAP